MHVFALAIWEAAEDGIMVVGKEEEEQTTQPNHWELDNQITFKTGSSWLVIIASELLSPRKNVDDGC